MKLLVATIFIYWTPRFRRVFAFVRALWPLTGKCRSWRHPRYVFKYIKCFMAWRFWARNVILEKFFFKSSNMLIFLIETPNLFWTKLLNTLLIPTNLNPNFLTRLFFERGLKKICFGVATRTSINYKSFCFLLSFVWTPRIFMRRTKRKRPRTRASINPFIL